MDPRKLGTVSMMLVVAVLALSVGSCDSRSPDEKIAQNRAQYQVELHGWVIKGGEEPVIEEGPALDLAEGEEPVEPETEEPAARGELEEVHEMEGLDALAEDAPPEPVFVTVLLNLVVSHDSYDPLPGLTVDVNQADQSGADKALHHCWVETADIPRVVPSQADCVLEDIEVAPGDMFAVQIRHAIPPDEMGDYREFQSGS